ncbi:MAG: hydroxymethylglutaryl-CoA synthase [Saprospiraceae bacterium]
MSITDAHEDAATMAANAVLDLILKNELDPSTIGRIYLGTESALDGAKPTATYVLDMLNDYLAPIYGPDCLLNCDVVDLTFACIGAVDALQNTLEWVQIRSGRIGIVVASDIAQYELGSGGEYTQGAGAVAMLVKENPRLLELDPDWGVATRPVHDFFKPLRQVKKEDIIREVLQLMDDQHMDIEALVRDLSASIEVKGVLDANEAKLTLHKSTPVFDGPYSNDCYQQRIGEALANYLEESGQSEDLPVIDKWDRLIFHLPYAFQARRMFSEIYVENMRKRGEWKSWAAANGMELPEAGQFEDVAAFQKAEAQVLRAVTKTQDYRNFVNEKIESGERASSLMGNLYAGSIFLSLMSTLEVGLLEEHDLDNGRLGFFGYGSGSKSKVFTGTLQAGWQQVVRGFRLFERLEQRQAIDYDTYEQLHRGELTESVLPPAETFFLKHVETERGVREGARSYGRFEKVGSEV